MTCKWPEGTCACWAKQQTQPDPHGRVWMHCEEGLSQTKASMARFMMFVLSNRVELGSVSASGGGRYHGATVEAAVLLKPELIEAFERETGGKLRKPPRVHLN